MLRPGPNSICSRDMSHLDPCARASLHWSLTLVSSILAVFSLIPPNSSHTAENYSSEEDEEDEEDEEESPTQLIPPKVLEVQPKSGDQCKALPSDTKISSLLTMSLG